MGVPKRKKKINKWIIFSFWNLLDHKWNFYWEERINHHHHHKVLSSQESSETDENFNKTNDNVLKSNHTEANNLDNNNSNNTKDNHSIEVNSSKQIKKCLPQLLKSMIFFLFIL